MKYVLLKKEVRPFFKHNGKLEHIDGAMKHSDGQWYLEGDIGHSRLHEPTEQMHICPIAYADDPKEFMGIIQKKPHCKYMILSGEVSEVKVQMPVYMDGKHLATVKGEWEC